MPRLHLTVRGRVQGVFYRSTALERARDLGLKGWVRNRVDGSVELVAEGDGAAIAALRAWGVKGPPGAVVRSVEEKDEPETGEFTSFGVRGDV
jgi:acylphosphatase